MFFGAYWWNFWNLQHGRSFERCIKLRHPSVIPPKGLIIYPIGSMFGIIFTYLWLIFYGWGNVPYMGPMGIWMELSFSHHFLLSMHYMSGLYVFRRSKKRSLSLLRWLASARNQNRSWGAAGNGAISMVCISVFLWCMRMPIQSTTFVAICGTTICLLVCLCMNE